MAARSRFVSVFDQGLNSVSNFALVIFAATGSTATEFGQFSIAYAFFVFLLGASRALIGETALVHESREGVAVRPAALAGAAVAPAVVGAVLLAAIALFVAPEYRGLWFALALAVLVALVQDALRYAFLAQGRPERALLIDAVWTVPSLIAMLLLALGGAGAVLVTLAWALGALLSVVVGCALIRIVPRPVQGLRWLRGHRSSAVRYTLEFASLNASTLVVWIALVPLIGAAGVGALRGAQLLLSPLNTVFTALRIAMIPELIRVRAGGRFRRRLLELAVLLGGATVVWSLLVLLIGDDLGRLVLGDTWAGAEPLRIAFVVQYLLMAAYTLILTVFRVDRLDKASTRMRGVLAVLTLVLPLALAAGASVQGAAWGFAVAVACSAVVGAILLARRPPAPPAG